MLYVSDFDMDLETLPEDYVYSEPTKYGFRAICTSDICRLISKSNKDRTDVGAIKHVSKNTIFCPDCEYALFWEKKAQ